MQKTLLVSTDTEELNKHLADGWKVLYMCALQPKISEPVSPLCLIVLDNPMILSMVQTKKKK